MTQDEIIEMARQAKWSGIYSQWVSPTERTHLTVPVTMEQIETFAKLVDTKATEREREECAKLVDDNAKACINNSMAQMVLYANATAIRARGNT